MTEPGSGENKPDILPDVIIDNTPDSANDVLGIGKVVKGLEIVSEYLGDPSEEARRVGRKALEVIKHELLVVQAKTTGDIPPFNGITLSRPTVSLEQQERIKQDGEVLDLFDQLKDDVHDGIFAVDPVGKITLFTKAVEVITGRNAKELNGLPFESLIHPEDVIKLTQHIEKSSAIDHETPEVRVVNKDGTVRWVRLSTYFSSSADEGDPRRFAGLMHDVTESVNLRSHDQLTGLHSRHYFDEEMDKLRVSREDNFPVSFIYIDLDDFKKTNDTLGHTKGDELLVEFAKLLRRNSRLQDCIARMGGDEFVILLQKTSEKAALQRIKRIQDKMEIRNQRKQSDAIHATFGSATAISNESLDQSREASDIRMIKAKKEKKDKEKRKNQLKPQLEE
jgi:diguanylate cyclase (GGDEF)-like protein/PAS domain S-box-containing protein